MTYDDYKLLKIRVDRGVAFATIDNPPINLLTIELTMELGRFAGEVAADEAVRVVVFDSADPDFFIAHFDVSVLAQLPDQAPAKSEELHGFNMVNEAFRVMPKATIAKIEGIARGGGSEFVLSLDMRFGAIGKAVLAQPEVSIGIIPGGGGTQRLPRLMGRSRAMEVVLGCADFSAEMAERYGYINRALDPDELTPFVEDLAYTIAAAPAEAIAFAKKAVLAAQELPLVEGLLEETHLFNQSAATPAAKQRMAGFMEMGGQTREVELDFSKMFNQISKG